MGPLSPRGWIPRVPRGDLALWGWGEVGAQRIPERIPRVPQEKQTKEALTRKQQKCRRRTAAEEANEAPELLKRPREYTVRFTFPNPPPLSPPVLGLHGTGGR